MTTKTESLIITVILVVAIIVTNLTINNQSKRIDVLGEIVINQGNYIEGCIILHKQHQHRDSTFIAILGRHDINTHRMDEIE